MLSWRLSLSKIISKSSHLLQNPSSPTSTAKRPFVRNLLCSLPDKEKTAIKQLLNWRNLPPRKTLTCWSSMTWRTPSIYFRKTKMMRKRRSWNLANHLAYRILRRMKLMKSLWVEAALLTTHFNLRSSRGPPARGTKRMKKKTTMSRPLKNLSSISRCHCRHRWRSRLTTSRKA